MNLNFIKAQIAERTILCYTARVTPKIQIKSITSLTKKDSHDAVILSANTEYKSEIKVRNGLIERYPDYILEYGKYWELNKTNSLYINFFQDGVLIWNIRDIYKRYVIDKSLTFIKMSLPETTANGKSEMIDKPVFLLKPEWAERIELELPHGENLQQMVEQWIKNHKGSNIYVEGWTSTI